MAWLGENILKGCSSRGLMVNKILRYGARYTIVKALLFSRECSCAKAYWVRKFEACRNLMNP
jgi:hypothetical protein